MYIYILRIYTHSLSFCLCHPRAFFLSHLSLFRIVGVVVVFFFCSTLHYHVYSVFSVPRCGKNIKERQERATTMEKKKRDEKKKCHEYHCMCIYKISFRDVRRNEVVPYLLHATADPVNPSNFNLFTYFNEWIFFAFHFSFFFCAPLFFEIGSKISRVCIICVVSMLNLQFPIIDQ